MHISKNFAKFIINLKNSNTTYISAIIKATTRPAWYVHLDDQWQQEDCLPAGTSPGNCLLHSGRGTGQALWQTANPTPQGEYSSHMKATCISKKGGGVEKDILLSQNYWNFRFSKSNKSDIGYNIVNLIWQVLVLVFFNLAVKNL